LTTTRPIFGHIPSEEEQQEEDLNAAGEEQAALLMVEAEAAAQTSLSNKKRRILRNCNQYSVPRTHQSPTITILSTDTVQDQCTRMTAIMAKITRLLGLLAELLLGTHRP